MYGLGEVRDIGRFVRARRESANAADYVELPNRRRHVKHLTQNDLADLVDISTVVISQIEQGRYPNLNMSILRKIAEALRLTRQQQVYIFGLLSKRPKDQATVEPAPQWVLESIRAIQHPVVVTNPLYDILEINQKAKRLFAVMDPQIAPKRNSATSIFQTPTVREFIEDWPAYAASLVSGLKMSYAMNPGYRDAIDRLAERLTASEDYFGELWSKDDPLVKPSIHKTFNHPEVGTLNVMQVLSDIVEEPWLTRIEFMPADDETRQKMEQL